MRGAEVGAGADADAFAHPMPSDSNNAPATTTIDNIGLITFLVQRKRSQDLLFR